MDIDKLGLSTMNFKKDGSSDFKEGSDEYYQNQLIKDYITLLTDKNSHHILHRSIDNDTKLLKDVLAEIETSSSKPEQPYGFYSLSTQTERKNDYITGKIGIGPFALNNNSHILTMLYGVKFKEFDTSIMKELGLTDLSIHKDIDGNSIMSWLSALINAHVDIAKDPYISRLNVNQFTYNLVNTLIRTGLGKKTFYFTTQPIIKEIAKAYINAGSAFMADQNKAQYQLQKEAVEKVAENMFKSETFNGWKFEQMVEGVQDPQDVVFKPVINDYIRQIFDGGTLKTNANKSFKEAKGVGKLSANQVQMLMYLAYLQFEPYALSVSNLVKYSKIDTKKHGKSYIEQQVFLKGFKDLFYNEEGTGLFEESGIRRLAENSYIALKTINAISMTKNILKGQFLQSTNAFNNAVQQVLNMIGRSDSKSVDLHTKISKAIMASIKSEFINQYAKDISNGNPTYIRDLVSESEEDLQYEQSAKSNRIKVIGTPKYDLSTYVVGGKADVEFTHEGNTWHFQYNIIGYDRETNELIVDTERKVDNVGKLHLSGGKNTIYDRFVRLAAELRDDPEYKDVLDSSGEPYNKLLRNIVPGKEFRYQAPASTGVSYAIPEMQDTYPTLKFVKLFNALDNNGVESNYIIDGWDELLHDTKHPKLKKFAEDLVVYAFVTSGDQGGFTKFFKQVPFSWRKESGYGDFINRKLVEFQTEDISTEQLQDAILNNWFDNQLVPTYRLSGQDGPNFMVYSANRQATGYRAESKFPLILAALRNKNGVLEPSIDPNTAPVFIKVPRREEEQAKDSQRRFTVFKRVSYGMRKSSTGDWIHYPIYIKVEPKGNLLRGNYLMTEYGREDSTNKEYVANENGLKAMYALGDFIKDSTIQEYSMKWGNVYAQMVEDMNYRDLFVNTYESNINEFDKAVRANSLVVNREVATVKQLTIQTVEQLQGLLKSMGLTVKNKADMEKFFKEHPNALGKGIIQKFIGKKARTRFEQQLMKARPDLATPHYILKGIDFIKDAFSDDYIPNNGIDPVTARNLVREGLMKEGTFSAYVLTDKGKAESTETRPGIDAALNFLHSLEDNKENTAYIKTAVRWIANRSITLPQDNVRARQAFDLARKKNLDLQKYATLGELISSPEMQPKAKEKPKFNPDEAKTFSNKRTVTTKGGRIFTVYDVEDTAEGQREVCKALWSNYEVSPWCLSTFTATGEPTESAKRYWAEYSGIPRKIAYENGKPVAFSSDRFIENENSQAYSIEELPLYRNSDGSFDIVSGHPDTIQKLLSEGKVELGPLDNYRVTEKGKQFIQKYKQPQEAWWDMLDDHPHKYLSDEIISDPDTTNPELQQEALIAEEYFRQQRMRENGPEEDFDETEWEAYLNSVNWEEDAENIFAVQDAYYLFFMTPEGEIFGFVDKDGNIYLDETIISPEHPIHEYTHLWDRIVAKKNPKLWKRGIELMKQTSLWNEVANSDQYGKQWKVLEGITPEKLESLIASEVHSRFTGEGGAKLLDQLAKEKGQEGIISKLKEWILDFWKDLKATFSNWSDEELSRLTLKDFNYMPVRDFADALNLQNPILPTEKSNFTKSEIQFSENLPTSDTKINIYAGTGENADLSNFAERPFTIKGSAIGAPDSNKDYSFKTVEHAFQAAKTFYTDLLAEERDHIFKEIVEAKTAMQARALGKRIPKLDRNDWDTYSSEIMKDLIKASFEQNTQALQRLLATGNATLTHTQDRGKWGKEFPRLLMEVREELRGQQQQASVLLNMTNRAELFNGVEYSEVESLMKEAEEIKKQCKGG